MRLIISIVLISIVFANDEKMSELENVQVLPYTKKADIMKYMKKTVSKELGVKCNFCHNIREYSSDEIEHKLVAREMMRMVLNINENTFKPMKRDEISCWVCHRGQKHPELLK